MGETYRGVEGVKGWALGWGFHRLVGVESCWVGFDEAGVLGCVSFFTYILQL